MIVSTTILEQLFSDFLKFLKQHKNENFQNFKTSPLINKDENYKYQVSVEAKLNLDQKHWKEADIGTGRIQKKVVSAIQPKLHFNYEWHNNNLIDWRKKDDFSNRPPSKALEQTLFNFFKYKIKDPEAFQELLNLKISYQFIAYLYFIRDSEHYLPITQERFDEIFVLLELSEFKTSGRASWENYLQYLDILKQVRDFLKTKDSNTTLLDAHSFLYILGSQMKEAKFAFTSTVAICNQTDSIGTKDLKEDSLIREEILFRKEDEVEFSEGIITNGKTYLFVWNPLYWPWEKLESNIEEVYRTGTYIEDWSCGVTKSINVGHRFFLMKLGTDPSPRENSPKGIIGSGSIVREPYTKSSIKDPNKNTPHVDLRFDNLLNPYKEEILALDVLNSGLLASQHWTPQSSGISIKQDLVNLLEADWFKFLSTAKIRHNPFLLVDTATTYTEGIPYQITQTVYERNPHARKACIAEHGTSCFVCSFNFEEIYGELGKDFIHVHHLNHISKIGESYNINPVNDLRPVCPNCHAMLHRQKDGITIEHLKSLFKSKT